ncbi:MAG: hypothetical protein ABI165_09130 [Bryobacteraceae bacterium]
MAKFKTAKAKGKALPSKSAIPCFILILLGIVFLSLLFYGILKSGS